MSLVDLFKALDDRGLVDLQAVARELAELGYGAPSSHADGPGDGEARFAIVGGRDEPEVLVAPADDDNAEPVLLRVTGESVPVYTARRVR